MNKTELTNKVAEKGLSKKDAATAVNAVFEIIKDELAAGGNVQLIGFGTFSVAEVGERTSRNPQTNAPMTIPAHKAPKFKFAAAIKDAVK